MPFGQKEKTTNVIKAPRVIDSHALASAWLVTIIILVLQGTTLLPFAAASAVYAPQLLTKPFGTIYMLGGALAWSLLLSGAVRLLVRSVPRATWLSSGAIALLAILHAVLLGASSFYAKFGTYPLASVFGDFIAAPTPFIAYTKSGAAISDGLWIGAAILAVIGGAVSLNRIVRVAASLSAAFAVVDLSCAVALLVTMQSFPSFAMDRQHSFQVSQHGMPLGKYVYDTIRKAARNRVEVAEPYLPRATGDPAVAAPRPNARHVLLVLAECLRADHLPSYGYDRNTTPFITSEQQNWIVFDKAYSHASRTTDSFPVIFNSRYFAAIDRRNDGAVWLWSLLKQSDVRSAFLSAGAMEWGGMLHALALSDVDRRFIASDASDAERRLVTTAAFDYAVDDQIPLSRYFSLLRNDFGGQRSFVTLHFVGSHYPFTYTGSPDLYSPNLRDSGTPAGQKVDVQLYEGVRGVAAEFLQRVSNSYDNSIRHVDSLIRLIVNELDASGLSEDTLIVLSADHGESLGEHRTLFHGTSLYDEQVHVPLLVRVGKNLAHVRGALTERAGHVAGQVDLMPTILDLFGVSRPAGSGFEGESWLSGRVKPYELLLFRGIGEKIALVSDERKFIYDVTAREAEEYDLSRDPAERLNLWSKPAPQVTDFLSELLRAGLIVSTESSR